MAFPTTYYNEAGRAAREDIEVATDRQLDPAIARSLDGRSGRRRIVGAFMGPYDVKHGVAALKVKG